MPELGKYAIEVVSAYAVSLILLGLLVAVTLNRGRAAKAALVRAEREAKVHG
jgi:heme exporter protein D